ncbi:hypothetical protein GIS00_11605 [Nakamurella sp. YIM 132087]|uniref:SRPBCC family protein n=1 Tax=Nakamurella alba TaxID=2665158 RepID=A0A7K1FKF5_9ACTN|nr:hypothetical protein [Nakamurella alba]MTD14588.1 hypothetical protein [Nakamurella alba]
MFAAVRPTPAETAAALPGDGEIERADVVMDTAFSVPAPPEVVWPWLLQLGKGRAGWYLPTSVERFLPRRHRAVREIHDSWLHLEIGERVPDYGPGDAHLQVELLDPPHHLVYSTPRKKMLGIWSLHLTTEGTGTRVALRLRLGPVRRRRLARTLGGLFDRLTVLGMAAGLRERLAHR